LKNDDDQWSLAFLDLRLKKAHCGHCDQDSDVGSMANETIQKAYHMIEHDLEPGSLEAAELSELTWKVEQGDEDHEKLQELMKKLKPEQEASEGSYQDVFEDLLNSFLSKYNVSSLNELPDDAKKTLFEEIDTRWTAKNEADTRLASLGIPRVAELQAIPDFYMPGAGSSGVGLINLSDDMAQEVHEKFDVTDVESGQDEWEQPEVELGEEDIEELNTRLVNPEEVSRIVEKIKTLAPSDKEALELYLKS